MRFFLPDSHDLVDPSFDFASETRDPFRDRQRDDRYAHEVFDRPPFEGLLVSMAAVERGAGTTRYTLAQRHRLRRHGARRFFRLPDGLQTMGDCGAFTWIREHEPPLTTAEVVDFYNDCGFDFGIAVDHIISGFNADLDCNHGDIPAEWIRRQGITFERAREFLRLCRRVPFEPVGVAQGWSPLSYAAALDRLQREGFTFIAIGGLVSLKTEEILLTLEACAAVRRPATQLHLLGISRASHASDFRRYGVVSIDSTSPLRQAFKDERLNYYTPDGAFSAVRVPQVDANPRMQRRIGAGEIDRSAALRLERACLSALTDYDAETLSLDGVMDAIGEYAVLHGDRPARLERYRQVLDARPWRSCPCDICRKLGHHVILFRGAERNRRRGFHNVYVFHRRLRAVDSGDG